MRLAVDVLRVVSVVCFVSLTSELVHADVAGSAFSTWPGWEPDKAATAWYWVRHVDSHARIRVVPAGTSDGSGIFFDTPDAAYHRSQNLSTLESVLRAHPTSDPAILKLARLTHDIEINAWRPRAHAESVILETAFHRIQTRWPAGDAPVACLLAFFDVVHNWLASSEPLRSDPPAECAR